MSLEKLIKLVGSNKFYEFWDSVNNEATENELLPYEYFESFADIKDIYPDQPCSGDEVTKDELLPYEYFESFANAKDISYGNEEEE